MMECAYSEVSCGVNQIYGFENYREYGYDDDDDGERSPGDVDLNTVLRDVSKAIYLSAADQQRYDDKTSRLRLGAVHYVFSDIEGLDGDLFGRWLMEQKLGAVFRTTGTNPNSGNNIATYLWMPDEAALKKVAAWKEGRTCGLERLRKIREGGW